MLNANYALVLNCGSSSLKFAIIDPQTGNEILSGLAECLLTDEARFIYRQQGDKHQCSLSQVTDHQVADHQKAIDKLVAIIEKQQLGSSIKAVGHRVVHGGEAFVDSVLVDEAVKLKIEALNPLAPLHNPANLVGINAAQAAFPHLPQVAVFDTAFHQTMPKQAFTYALPRNFYTDHGVRKYGFHGTSHQYVAQQAANLLQQPANKLCLVTAHLGNGCSLASVKEGKSVDTSMGLTPLAGLVMGTRCGDIDPGILHFMTDNLGLTSQQVNELLNKKSGLLGLSQHSNDCRALLHAEQQGDELAKLALDVFCYQLAKSIAAHAVPLGRLDALVFTGGIGENAAPIRARVLDQLCLLGFVLDETANQDTVAGQAGQITLAQSTTALVIPTNEERVIAGDALRVSQVNAHQNNVRQNSVSQIN
ncbi:acetate kinase [Saccharobesus litoralis]|uniref:Acetate kinase n=1 Tax=Saccharobesus litoralis TaxID=2172099 RepID=A0A2S0VVK4_9ALTE|nr:acetate kinase [Saccharobesus litoralis]AWB68225.1 acetate kinase [Saccharobesus litoralis]